MRSTDGQATADDCLRRYHAHYPYTGDAPPDLERRREDSRVIRLFGPTFRPGAAVADNPDAPVPAWRIPGPRAGDRAGRRVRVGQAQPARPPATGRLRGREGAGRLLRQGRRAFLPGASLDATLANFRGLRARGLVGWVCTPNQYARLMAIAVAHDLLAQLAPPVRPRRRDGAPDRDSRVVGPGPRPETEHALLQLHEAWMTRRSRTSRGPDRQHEPTT